MVVQRENKSIEKKISFLFVRFNITKGKTIMYLHRGTGWNLILSYGFRFIFRFKTRKMHYLCLV